MSDPLPLKTYVLELLDRKLMHLHAIDVINADLEETYRLLGEIPSLSSAPDDLAPVQPRGRRYTYLRPTVIKVCETVGCGATFEGFKDRRFCKACFGDKVRERLKGINERRQKNKVAESILKSGTDG
jgi:hypothetical protein